MGLFQPTLSRCVAVQSQQVVNAQLHHHLEEKKKAERKQPEPETRRDNSHYMTINITMADNNIKRGLNIPGVCT